jgi:hypothetical protein
MTDQELKDLVAGLAVAQAALTASQDRTDAQMARTEAQMARTEAQMARTDERMARTDERMARTDERMARTDDKIVKMQEGITKMELGITKMQETVASIGRQLGGIGDNQGAVAEEFFYNSLVDKPRLGGLSFDRVLKNIGAGKPGKAVEFDIVMHNGAAMAIVEVKYKVHPNSLDQIEKQMRRYRELFPEYKDYALYGGVAGFSVPDDVVELAHERGLFVLKRKGDIVETDTGAMRAFRPES